MNRPDAPPAYGALIEAAREAAGLSRREAARRAGISDAWWRYVVQGWQNGPISGPADTVAKMALVVGVTPKEMEEAGERADAARELRKLLQPPVPLRPVPGASPAAEAAVDEILADLAARYEGEAGDVVRAMAAQRGKGPGARLTDILRFLKDPDLDQEIVTRLVAAYPGEEVIQVMGRQRLRKPRLVAEDILEFLGWRPPEMEAGNGTAG